MSNIKGFVMPLVMVLLLITSLLVTALYEVEQEHLTLFDAAKQNQTKRQQIETLQAEALAIVKTTNQNWSGLQPDPTTAPQVKQAYLRYIAQDYHRRIWQIKVGQVVWLIQCQMTQNWHCFRIQRIP